MKEWHRGKEGYNFKYNHETLLNYGMNRWGLNKSSSVGKTSDLIRDCAPHKYDQWLEYYFQKAQQNKHNGVVITGEYITELGAVLYTKLTEVVAKELESISLEECIDYVFNLVINRTYEGYLTEIKTIYGYLEHELQREIKPAPDEWDRLYNVDFFIQIYATSCIGIQIKPLTGKSLNDYQWGAMHRENHNKFTKKLRGKYSSCIPKRLGIKK